MIFKGSFLPSAAVALLLKLFGVSSHAVVVDLPRDGGKAAEKKRIAQDRLGQFDEVVQSRVKDSNGFPFWEHVGMVGMGSGIYLGDGFVLTSAHVGCFPFQLIDGSYYKPDYQSWTILEGENGGRSDLAVYRVFFDADSKLAKLGALPVASSAPLPEHSMLFIGAGLTQSPNPSILESNGRTLAVLGYRLEGKREPTWGFNSLSEVPGDPVKTGEFNTDCFVTTFNRSGFEAQAVDGDSGGASFVFNPQLKRWELAGCIIGVTQKGAYVPFGSRTFLANLARYRDQLPGLAPVETGIDMAEQDPMGSDSLVEDPMGLAPMEDPMDSDPMADPMGSGSMDDPVEVRSTSISVEVTE